ncbi:hypothetical protein [Priestia megaterium]|uniref:hypothetical protein n=1 Tax=Priestia megaterium TaxID=1404 RepID=UPI0028142854|nr:hypothetical protein [Priestia megaterium]MDR0128668.1 hypothetical protein [Priestia megaterium]
MKQKDWVEEHLNEVLKYQQMLERTPDEMKVHRIEIMSKMLVFIGKLAATFSEEYKNVYADRKVAYAEAELAAEKYKQAHAEIAVKELRKQEATAYGNMQRWRNAFESTKEEINALKYKVKIDIEDGSSRIR